jgi:glycosyltransferase involved in cell wall biosynthesis
MKISILAHRFELPLIGGVAVYTDRLGRALKRAGHEVNIIALDDIDGVTSIQHAETVEEYRGIQIDRIRFSFKSRPKEAFHLAYDGELGLKRYL